MDKKRVVIGLFLGLSLLVLFAGRVSAENLVKNPGFEKIVEAVKIEGEQESSLYPASWRIGKKSKGSVAVDNTIFHTGKNSLKLISPLKERDWVVYQYITTEKLSDKTMVKIGGWIKTQNLVYRKAGFLIHCWGENNKWLTKFNISGPGGTLDWSYIEETKEIPKGTTKIGLSLNPILDEGTVWFDDITLEIMDEKKDAIVSREKENPLLAKHNNLGDGKNILPGDTSFETGNSFLWYDEYAWARKKSIVDGATSVQGKKSIKLPPDSFAIRLDGRCTINLSKGVLYTFSFYMKADSPDSQLELQLLEQPGYKNLCRAGPSPSTKWKRYSFPFTPKQFVSNCSIHLGNKGKGNIWIDCLQLEKGKLTDYKASESVSVDIKTGEIGNILYPADNLNLNVDMYNNTAGLKKDLIFSYIINDYYGKKIKEEKRKISISPNFLSSFTIPLENLKERGFFLLRYNLKENDKIIKKGWESFAIVFPPSKKGRFFGMQANDAFNIKAGARIGIRWGMLYMNKFPYIAPEEDRFSWWRSDKLIKLAEKHDIELVPQVRYPAPKWARKNEKEGFPIKEDAMEKIFFEMANRYKGKIKYYELGNEPKLDLHQHCSLSEEEIISAFAENIKSAYKGIKRADPAAKLSTCSVTTGDMRKGWPFTHGVFQKVSRYIDVFPPHPYSWPYSFQKGSRPVWPEENKLRKKLQEARAIVEKYGNKDTELWIGEKGWRLEEPTEPDSILARDFASCTARALILARSVPEVERFSWFAVPCGKPSGARLFADGHQPYIAAVAYATTAHFLDEIKSTQPIKLGASIQSYLFEKEDCSIATLWTTEEKPIPIELEVGEKKISIYDLMGNLLPEERMESNKIKLVLTKSPLFVQLKERKSSTETLSKILSTCKVKNSVSLIAELQLNQLSRVTFLVANRISQTLKGKAKLIAPFKLVSDEVSYQIPPAEMGKIGFTLKEKDLNRINNSEIKVIFKDQTGETTYKDKITIFPIFKVKKPITIDSNLREWKDTTPVKLNRIEQLHPDLARYWKGIDDLSGDIYLGWDEENFYFAAKVKDNIHMNKHTGARLWDGDCIQMGFDTLNSAAKLIFTDGYDKDDYEYNIALTKEGPQITCSQYKGESVSADEKALIKDVSVSVKREGDYLIYELALPFSKLFPLSPEKGKVFGYNAVIVDDDMGAGRQQHIGLSSGICEGGKNPVYFKDFVLWE